PDSLQKAEEAKRRFTYEELFLLELSVLREKTRIADHPAISLPIKLEAMQRFVQSLPFTLTDDQKKTVWRILKDMEKPRPMSRLLQGDVGSGKTAVAAIASLNAIKNGYQVVFMAPTEILASQHFKTISKIFEGFNANVGFLTGKHDEFISKKLKGQPIEISRRKLLAQIEKGDINIVVGTHALIQKTVKFDKLALVIIDEQHRFGVEQRAKLTKQKPPILIPHFLSMTATPIPRSLALTIYGDLDISVIKQLPKGRKPIITETISEDKRQETYDFIKKEIKKGRQAYVICPRIEESEKDEGEAPSPWDEVKSVTAEYHRLQSQIFPTLSIGLLHGKMSTKEKDRTMDNFKYGKIDILVSTSVVEVGVDVPNATVIVIEGAERFGLAQLHQFRGRVGRSEYQSYCFLFTNSTTSKSRERAEAMVDFSSGFDISRKDLEIRGPGDLVGLKQSGLPDLVMSSLTDISRIERIRETAIELLSRDPELKKIPQLNVRLKHFVENLHLE
ncbi:MAG TPA: ATP-dependent DNA helicase RecG, partial [Candidatus Pacearchaeota archaeon]|nr:ATP-dependent DNA helicase RecG [Candidatus Pacearchaeota archaeon]